jgi:hypothetical protein
VAKSAGRESINIGTLRKGYPCLLPESGVRLAFAAAVCLEERGRRPGICIDVSGSFEASFHLKWPKTSEQVRREWADPQEATEHGAVGIAILLVDQLTGYHIVQRSFKGTGFDYWLGPKRSRAFQRSARLEVSGIRNGDQAGVEKRVSEKCEQTKRSDNLSLPAFVVVVEFGIPVAVVVRR